MKEEIATGASGLDVSERLSFERTRLAYERTMMAWIRTATSMISFGFTIYKFFQYLRENEPATRAKHLVGPRGFGILMISLGLVTLLLATIQHRWSMNMMRKEYPEAPKSLAATLAALISTVGILALLAALLRQ
jgi:putative membrane protein